MKHDIDAMMIDINASMKIMFSTNCKKIDNYRYFNKILWCRSIIPYKMVRNSVHNDLTRLHFL